MRNINRIQLGSALLVMVLGFTGSQSHAEMMEKEKGMMGKEGSMMEGKMAEGKMMGMLTGAGSHRATGTLKITKDKNGRSVLTMTDITVDRVPDGRVYLAKDGDYTKGVELGKLTQFSGTVEYLIPVGIKTQDYNSVVIWCKKFGVEIGRGTFTGAMHEGM